MLRARISAGLVFLFALVLASHPAHAARGPRICPLDQVGAIFAQLDASCPCGDATSKRTYRKCVRLAGHEIMKASGNTLPRNCLRPALRCGNQSTCGVAGAVTCHRDKPSVCVSGVCGHDATISCATDQDCVLSVCDVRSSAANCDDDGGTAGAPGTCCAF
jgi:hypothetical protein